MVKKQKKINQDKNNSFLNYLSFGAVISYVLLAGMFLFILHVILKDSIRKLSDLFGGTVISVLSVCFLLALSLVAIIIYSAQTSFLKKHLSHSKIYFLLSLILLIFIVSLAIAAAGSILDDVYSFEGTLETSENIFIGIYSCSSVFYTLPTKLDGLTCDVDIKTPEILSNKNITLYKVTFIQYPLTSRGIGEGVFSSGHLIINGSLNIPISNIHLLSEDKLWFEVQVEQKQNDKFVGTEIISTRDIYPRDESFSAQVKNGQKNIVYTILMFTITVALGSVFVGVNNLRQLVQNSGENNE